MPRTTLHFLLDIREAADNILEYTNGLSYEQFLANRMVRDAVARNFEIIGEGAKRLPGNLKEQYPDIAWRRLAGLRDIVAHQYFRVDYELLWGVIRDTLPKFSADLDRIIREQRKGEKRTQGEK